MRLLSRAEVLARIGIPIATWYRMRQRGEFPPPTKLGAHVVGWLQTDVDAWLKQRGIIRCSK